VGDRLRDTLRRAATVTGLAPPLRRLRDRTVEALAPGRLANGGEDPAKRRNDLDGEQMRRLLAFTLRADAGCIDVGAYEGDVLADLLRMAPLGRHIAYEPLPQLHARLVARFPGVDVRHAALSDRDGESSFVHVRDLPQYSGLRVRAYPRSVDSEVIQVRTERLDDHLPEGFVPAFMKIDVEGAECLVIAGALRTIAEHRPTLVVEHGPGGSDHYGSHPRDLHRLLCTEAGLRIFDLDGDGPYSLDRLEESYATGARWNYVVHA
jgi:FkbM family methyltransferase